MKHLAAIAFFLFLKSMPVFAQQGTGLFDLKKDKNVERPLEIETLLILTNGGQVRGKLTEWVPGEYVVLTTFDSVHLKLPESMIDRMKQFRYGGPPVLKDAKQYEFSERGRFFSLSLGIIPGLGDGGGFGDGGSTFMRSFTFAAAAGYQLNRGSGLGLGFGVDKYGNYDDMTIVPVFLDFRGYLLRRPRTPYFDLMIGHGFAAAANFFEGSGQSVDEKDGGLFISPNLGIRLGARRSGNLTIDFGARFQRCSYRSSGFGGVFMKDINYQRYGLRIGMVF